MESIHNQKGVFLSFFFFGGENVHDFIDNMGEKKEQINCGSPIQENGV